MPVEIERKFLVKGEKWRGLLEGEGQLIRQGYICRSPQRTVRIRTYGKAGFLTIKTSRVGISRNEYEFPISFTHACELLDSICVHPLIEKIRYRIPWEKLIIEVDEFRGENAGLVVAEVELPNIHAIFEQPDWFGEEVSQDVRYRNSQLTVKPYCEWKAAAILP